MSRPGDPEFEEIVRRIVQDPAAAEAMRDELAKLTLPGRRRTGGMPQGWYIIRVELLSGGAADLEPPPGRDYLVSPHHTFRQFADAINAGFGRWDLGHLYAFRMADGTEIGIPDEGEDVRDVSRSKIANRAQDEVFAYVFDFGDGWRHRCTVQETDVTPEDVYGVKPKGPVAVWGWGSIPDQYGRTTPGG